MDELRVSWKNNRTQTLQYFIDIVHEQVRQGLITSVEAKRQLQIIPLILSEELDH